MTNQQRCPYCHAVLEIKAEHTYSIAMNNRGRWIKSTGDVSYTCDECDAELSKSDIRDALEQTDEL